VCAGLAIGHPAIIYDNVTDLYWMASNMNRDSTRRWRQPWQPTLPKLHITPFSKCEVGPPVTRHHTRAATGHMRRKWGSH
jgi:hypothetical protein